MKKSLQMFIIGLSIFAFNACGDNNNIEARQVALADIVNTGPNGYEINVEVDNGVERLNKIIYFCTDAIEGFDYALYDASSSFEPWIDIPDDYGYTAQDGTLLALMSMVNDGTIEVYTDPTPEYLQEGETYNYADFGLFEEGTIYINNINDFDCSSLQVM